MARGGRDARRPGGPTARRRRGTGPLALALSAVLASGTASNALALNPEGGGPLPPAANGYAEDRAAYILVVFTPSYADPRYVRMRDGFLAIEALWRASGASFVGFAPGRPPQAIGGGIPADMTPEGLSRVRDGGDFQVVLLSRAWRVLHSSSGEVPRAVLLAEIDVGTGPTTRTAEPRAAFPVAARQARGASGVAPRRFAALPPDGPIPLARPTAVAATNVAGGPASTAAPRAHVPAPPPPPAPAPAPAPEPALAWSGEGEAGMDSSPPAQRPAREARAVVDPQIALASPTGLSDGSAPAPPEAPDVPIGTQAVRDGPPGARADETEPEPNVETVADPSDRAPDPDRQAVLVPDRVSSDDGSPVPADDAPGRSPSARLAIEAAPDARGERAGEDDATVDPGVQAAPTAPEIARPVPTPDAEPLPRRDPWAKWLGREDDVPDAEPIEDPAIAVAGPGAADTAEDAFMPGADGIDAVETAVSGPAMPDMSGLGDSALPTPSPESGPLPEPDGPTAQAGGGQPGGAPAANVPDTSAPGVGAASDPSFPSTPAPIAEASGNAAVLAALPPFDPLDARLPDETIAAAARGALRVRFAEARLRDEFEDRQLDASLPLALLVDMRLDHGPPAGTIDRLATAPMLLVTGSCGALPPYRGREAGIDAMPTGSTAPRGPGWLERLFGG